MKLKILPVLAVALSVACAAPSASAQTNQIPALQARIGFINQNSRGTAAVSAILNAYRLTVRLDPNRAAILLRIANRQINRFILPSQRSIVAVRFAQTTAAAFISAGIPATSRLYLETFPFIAAVVPVEQRTLDLLNQIADAAAFANEAVGGSVPSEVPVRDAIFGTGGTPPPVS